MTGSNRRSNAGRKAQPQQAKPKPRRAARASTARVTQSTALVPIVNSNANHRASNNRTVTMSGSDYLGTVSVKGDSSVAADKIRKTFPVSPSAYPGTRLAQLADLWERYRFRKFDIRYVPSVPTTLSAQVMVYQDTDPSDDPSVITDADALIRQATSQAGSQQWNFNQPKRISLASRADRMLYYTGSTQTNERQNLQGKAYFVQVSDALNFEGTKVSSDITCGSLYVDWEVEFQTPQINPDAVARSFPTGPPPAAETATFDLLFANSGDVTVSKYVPSDIPDGTYEVAIRRCNFNTSTDSATVRIESIVLLESIADQTKVILTSVDLVAGQKVFLSVAGLIPAAAWTVDLRFTLQ